MDEAERCHEIAYIAYGRADRARHGGRGHRRQAQLVTWRRRDRAPTACAAAPARSAGRRARRRFGRRCMSAGPTTTALERAAAPFRRRRAVVWQERAEPTLEDVFIHLMGKARGQLRGMLEVTTWLRGSRLSGWSPCIVKEVHAAPPRPAHLRDDARHAGHAAPAVRLRDQHRPAPPADRRAWSPTTAPFTRTSWRRSPTPATSTSSPRPRSRGRGATRCCAAARCSSS